MLCYEKVFLIHSFVHHLAALSEEERIHKRHMRYFAVGEKIVVLTALEV